MKSEPVQMVKRTHSTDFSWVTGDPAGLQDRLAKHLIGKIPPGAVYHLISEDGNYGDTLTVTYESPETPKEVAAREQLAKKRAAKIMQKEETERALLAELKKKYEGTPK